MAISIPIRIAFSSDVFIPLGSFWFFFELAVDLFFMVDIGLNFLTGYHNNEGMLEIDRRQIAQLYLRGWFLIDLVSCLPANYIVAIVQLSRKEEPSESAADYLRALKSLRLMRMAKMLRVVQVSRLVDQCESPPPPPLPPPSHSSSVVDASPRGSALRRIELRCHADKEVLGVDGTKLQNMVGTMSILWTIFFTAHCVGCLWLWPRRNHR